MTNLITPEQQERFKEYVARIDSSTPSLSCLTPDEREDMANYLDLWTVEQELTEIWQPKTPSHE